MLPFALLLVGAFATEDADKWHCWPGNSDAPYCGCQWITRDFQMINSTCTLQFPAHSAGNIHMLSVASSYPLQGMSDSANGKFVWTGYQGLSHDNLHDILYFFHPSVCYVEGYGEGYSDNMDDRWFNITMTEEKFKPYLSCEHYGGAWAGPQLGNFNYDIARSVQSYNLPIYGLGQGQTVTVTINPMHGYGSGYGLELMNVTAHHGHGTATADDCYNQGMFTYYQNPDHQGELEYAQFNLCNPHGVPDPSCWTGPDSNYCFQVPSSWDSEITV